MLGYRKLSFVVVNVTAKSLLFVAYVDSSYRKLPFVIVKIIAKSLLSIMTIDSHYIKSSLIAAREFFLLYKFEKYFIIFNLILIKYHKK